MKILITEEQYNLLLEQYEDKKYLYDFFDFEMEKMNYILESIKHKQKIKFKLINPVQYKRALEEFVKYGQFMRFPAAYVYKWKNIMVGNTAQLRCLNNIFGASQGGFPHDEFYDTFEIPEEERNYDFFEDYEKLDEIYKMDDYIPYFSNGQPVMSDYGLDPLLKLCKPLLQTDKPEEIIVIINKMLDVAHMRSDLPEIFIQGGSKALNYITYDEVLEKPLNENVQQTEKVYFNTGKLNDEDKQYILGITGGDNFTKVIADIYYNYIKKDIYWMKKEVLKNLPLIHKELQTYNKNVVPIEDFDIFNTNEKDFYFELRDRNEIINNLKTLPSIALRNLRNDIRKPRKRYGLEMFKNDLDYLIGGLSFLENREENVKEKILKKIFKSNSSLSQMIDFIDDKQNLIGGDDFTKEDILHMIGDDYYLDLIYDNNNVMVVRVESPDAIKRIGCNSLWCFTYGNAASRMWNDYSHNDMVYVIIDLNQPSDSSEFMHVLIEPLRPKYGENDNYPLFNMANENYYDPYSVLLSLFKDRKTIKKIFTFE